MIEAYDSTLSRCLQGKSAPCATACPFSLPIREFLEKLARGSFAAAARMYRSAVLFPEIASALCPAPCRGACCEQGMDTPVDLPALERAARTLAPQRSENYYLPPKAQRIAVLGASLPGCAFAARMAEKQYLVTVFEPSDRVCPELDTQLSRSIIEADVLPALQKGPCTLEFGTPIDPDGDYAGAFDLVYVPSGTTYRPKPKNVLRGRCGETVAAFAGALADVAGAEWFLRTGEQKKDAPAPLPVLSPTTQGAREIAALDKAAARQEAVRCKKCDCSACVDHCILLQQYGAGPIMLANDVGLALNVFPETQARAGMRQIGSCTDCGLCREVCPQGIDIGKFLLAARTELQSKRLLPPAHHEYWLRDMAFSNDEAAFTWIPEHCSHLFFPGCQLGGSDPRYVSLALEQLREKLPGCGITTRCCGAPARWAGDEVLYQAELDAIRTLWETSGKPVVLVACPSCLRYLHEQLPQISAEPVYAYLDAPALSALLEACVFDPCAARTDAPLRQLVREKCAAAGAVLSELPQRGDRAQCCSWGGHGYAVNPLFTNAQAKQQAAQSTLPYIAYCANCRDVLRLHGKSCYHVLDLLLGINDAERLPPTLSERREHRRELKRTLSHICGLPYDTGKEPSRMNLLMTREVAEKLSRDLILDEDIEALIRYCEQAQQFLLDEQTGHRIGHLRRSYITYWAEYALENGSWRLYNAYSHRMQLKNDCAVSPEDTPCES